MNTTARETGCMTLSDFLSARLDDDARQAASGIHTLDCAMLDGNEDHNSWCTCDYSARVLADIEAKRRIVDAVDILTGGEKSYLERLKHSDVEDAKYVIARRILALLALPYAEHADYIEEWRP